MSVARAQATLEGERLESTAQTVQVDLFGRKRRPEDDGFEVVEVRQEGPWKVEVRRRKANPASGGQG